jgi:hypothetical protein
VTPAALRRLANVRGLALAYDPRHHTWRLMGERRGPDTIWYGSPDELRCTTRTRFLEYIEGWEADGASKPPSAQVRWPGSLA